MRRHIAIASDIIKKAKREFNYTLKPEEKKEIRKQVKQMMGRDNLQVLYKGFYEWLERPEN
jgi:DNA helicase II / ATP-dependent DNA helicase PcrA